LDIIDYISANDITEFADIVDYAMDSGKDGWFRVLMNNGIEFIIANLESLQRQKRKED
jgi:hypothetical protein